MDFSDTDLDLTSAGLTLSSNEFHWIVDPSEQTISLTKLETAAWVSVSSLGFLTLEGMQEIPALSTFEVPSCEQSH